jgi:hypothetical protein
MDANIALGIAIAVAAASEIIALSPLKSNSIVQLFIQILTVVFPRRR